MDLLTFSQTLFYLVASIAIIIFGVLLVCCGYYLLQIIKNMMQISNNLNTASDDIREAINSVIEKILSLPIISLFAKRKKATSEHHKENDMHKKGRAHKTN